MCNLFCPLYIVFGYIEYINSLGCRTDERASVAQLQFGSGGQSGQDGCTRLFTIAINATQAVFCLADIIIAAWSYQAGIDRLPVAPLVIERHVCRALFLRGDTRQLLPHDAFPKSAVRVAETNSLLRFVKPLLGCTVSALSARDIICPLGHLVLSPFVPSRHFP